MENDVTVIFVSFHSEDIIENSIATIDQKIQIEDYEMIRPDPESFVWFSSTLF